MAVIHFLNVKEGDCSIIEHNSGRITVIDVCNAKPSGSLTEALLAKFATFERRINGNFQQKKYPVNPISYLKMLGVERIFRFILTHPDMDHMDGIKTLFAEFRPLNFWDTDNRKEMPGSAWEGSSYNEEDWKFYKSLRETKPDSGPRRLTLFSGARGKFYNVGDDGSPGGDGLYVLAPTPELVEKANESDNDYNDCSYVLLYRTAGNRIVFGGDSHDASWEHILNNHIEAVTDVDLLIAPHHGRKSRRSYEFLDVLRPKLTFFGNARSEHLAYNAWRNRGLSYITNNQANCMVVDASTTPMTLYVTHGHFARTINGNTSYNHSFRAWYVGPIMKGLIP